MGRATDYSDKVGDAICLRLAAGETLNEVCKTEGIPSERTVRTWALDPEHPFSPKYVRAREIGYLKMADELLEISDDATNDYMKRVSKDGEEYEVVNAEHIQRARLRVDTRKWLLSKMLPKVFGDKIAVGGDADNPIKGVIQIVTGVPRAE